MIEAHRPTNFDRLAQGSAAREAMISRVKAMASTSVVVETTVTDPAQFSNRRSRRASVFTTGALGVLSISAAALAACVGGSGSGEKSNLTPDPSVQGIAGAQAQPSTGPEGVTVIVESSPTAVQEAPTATVEAKLTQEQMLQIAGNVKQLITSGLSETPVTAEQISGNPIASNDYLDPGFVSTAVALCDLNNYGSPFVLSGRTVQPGDFDYASEFLINCAQPAIASKVLYKASGNEKFKQASEAWKPLHKQIVDEVRKKDPKISENFWKTTLNLYYTLQ